MARIGPVRSGGAKNGIGSCERLPEGWGLPPFSEILKRVERKVILDDAASYNCVGVRWYGKGAFVRENLLGMNIARKQQWIIRAGDVVYNKLFAWKGAFAVADASVHGCIVSDKFPTYAVNAEFIDPRFLSWYFRTPDLAKQAENLSKGAAAISKLTLNPPQFWDLVVPLPPVEEQRRIVARIEELAAKMEEARGLRQQSVEDFERLLVSMAHRGDLDVGSKRAEGWVEVSLGEVLRQDWDCHTVTTDTQYPNVGIYSYGRGLFPKPPITGISTSAKTLNRIHAGQFIYSRLFAFEGAYGEVPEQFDGSFVSNEYPTFECDPSRITSGFLFAYFKAPSVWSQVAAGSKGLGHRRQRVQPEQLLGHRLMLPPLEWQNRIRQVQAIAGTLMRLQAETAAELDALLPSILDKAFKGDL